MTVIDKFCHLYRDLVAFDISDLGKIYAQNIVFEDPVATHTGLRSVEQYFEKLLVSAKQCDFAIHNVISCESNTENIDYVVTWTMDLVLDGQSRHIKLDGITQLKITDDLIVYHRDYYDLGQMVYEHVPVVGWLVKKIKQRLGA